MRVEPSGDAVVAGHGQPNDQVALLLNGKAIANIDADGAGNFVIVPTPLAPGNYELTLEAQRPGEPLRLSRQVVTVSVPAKGQKNLVVARRRARASQVPCWPILPRRRRPSPLTLRGWRQRLR